MNRLRHPLYKWVILASMIPALAMTNIFWLTYAPITSAAAKDFHVGDLSIGLLSMAFMIVYIVFSFPASWLVDKKGFRLSMGVGAVITAIFGLMRWYAGDNFTLVTVATFGIAVGQPFMANSITKMAAKWFPLNERATATGIATMASYFGMVVAMILSPILYDKVGIVDISSVFGYLSVACAVVYLVFMPGRPPEFTNPADLTGDEGSGLNWANVRGILKNKSFLILMANIFIVMGIFNALMTWIDVILRPRHISALDAGVIGSVLVVVGLAGAIVIPLISDKISRRRPLLIWPIIAAVVGFAVFTFSPNYSVLLGAAALIGFSIMGMGPVAFQYGAEIAYPLPEGTSYGLLMVMGQISGIIFIYAMDAIKNAGDGTMNAALYVLLALMGVSFFLATRMKESPLILQDGKIKSKLS